MQCSYTNIMRCSTIGGDIWSEQRVETDEEEAAHDTPRVETDEEEAALREVPQCGRLLCHTRGF